MFLIRYENTLVCWTQTDVTKHTLPDCILYVSEFKEWWNSAQKFKINIFYPWLVSQRYCLNRIQTEFKVIKDFHFVRRTHFCRDKPLNDGRRNLHAIKLWIMFLQFKLKYTDKESDVDIYVDLWAPYYCRVILFHRLSFCVFWSKDTNGSKVWFKCIGWHPSKLNWVYQLYFTSPLFWWAFHHFDVGYLHLQVTEIQTFKILIDWKCIPGDKI